MDWQWRARSHSNGIAERRASEMMLKAKAKEAGRRITVGEDKAYDTADHVANLRAINVTPHVAQNDSITATGKRRQSAIDGRTTRHQGYSLSQSRRAMIECIFGWGKQHGTMRKTKHRGRASVAADANHIRSSRFLQCLNARTPGAVARSLSILPPRKHGGMDAT
jgi:hypothetical protein